MPLKPSFAGTGGFSSDVSADVPFDVSAEVSSGLSVSFPPVGASVSGTVVPEVAVWRGAVSSAVLPFGSCPAVLSYIFNVVVPVSLVCPVPDTVTESSSDGDAG